MSYMHCSRKSAASLSALESPPGSTDHWAPLRIWEIAKRMEPTVESLSRISRQTFRPFFPWSSESHSSRKTPDQIDRPGTPSVLKSGSFFSAITHLSPPPANSSRSLSLARTPAAR